MIGFNRKYRKLAANAASKCTEIVEKKISKYSTVVQIRSLALINAFIELQQS
jgi:hypothetical protein